MISREEIPGWSCIFIKLSFSIWLFSDENNVTNDIEIIPTDCVNCCSIESKWA